MKRLSQLFTSRERCVGVVAVSAIVALVGYLSLLWQYTIEIDEAKATSENHIESIYSKISEITGVTSSLATLYRITADFGSDELEQFTEDLIGVSESITSIGRFDRINRVDIDSFANLMSERGIYRFEIKTLNADGSFRQPVARDEHNAIVNLNPFTPTSARLIGVDLTDDGTVAALLTGAIKRNEVVLTPLPEGWPKTSDALMIVPTYAGRYIPQTAESRSMQNDGGYILELSFTELLTKSESISSKITLPAKVLNGPVKGEKRFRAFEAVFEGYRAHRTPMIGGSHFNLLISSPDGVSLGALVNAVVWMSICLTALFIVFMLISNSRRSDVRRQSVQKSLENERAIALTTIEAINDSVLTLTSDKKISYANPAAEAMMKLTSGFLVGRSLADSIPFSNQDPDVNGLNDIESNLATCSATRLEEIELRNGSKVTQVDCTFTPFGDNDSADGGVLVMRDVGKERALNRKLEHLATHDSLTGLVNRYYFELKLEELVEGAKRRSESHAVCYIDLDQFKIVNDTCGHAAGDKLLVQVTNSIKDNCRQNDVLARLGGDEFGLLITNTSEQECEAIARRLHEIFQSFSFVSGEHTFAIRACFGFVPINKNYIGVSDVMAAADIACYSAKDKGRNELHVFRPECEETSQRQGEMLLLPKLQKALAVDKFVLFVQPIAKILPVGTDATSKYEILLRMEDDDGSLITPFRLISAAERYDLMPEIDRWVINRAFHDVASLHEIYGDDLPMFSINLSGQSVMDGDLVGYILGKVAQTGVPPEKICFEITETSAMGDLSRALVLLEFLHDLGCKLALDDFGAGECSFGYLKNLPVDYLKVDGQFVRDVDTCDVHREMLRFVKRVAKLLDIETVAEFVENENILNCLREMDIDYAQGYHFSKPFHISLLQSPEFIRKAA